MQKHFKYLLVVLFAMPVALRAESENDIARKGCCGRFKKACVSGLLTAGNLNVCNGSIINGGQVVNAAPDLTCAGCNRTTRATCVDGLALTVNGATVLNGPLTENCLANFTNGLNVTGGCVTATCINVTGAGGCITTPCLNVTGIGSCINTSCINVTGSGACITTPCINITGATGSCITTPCLTVNGIATINTLDVTGNETVEGYLTVDGGATISGGVTSICSGTTCLTVGPTCVNATCFNVLGDETVAGDLTVDGDISVDGCINTSCLNFTGGGVANFTNVTITGTLDANYETVNNLTVINNETVEGSLTVNNLTVTNNQIIEGYLNVDNCITSSCLMVDNCITTSCLTVTGNETINGTITVNGCINTSCINITGATGGTGACITTPCLDVTGTATISTLEVTGDATVEGYLTVDTCFTTSCLNVTESFTLEGQPVSRSGYYFANYPAGSPDWNFHGSTNMATAGNWTISIGNLDNTLENPGASTQIWWFVVGDHSVVTIELAITGGGPLLNAPLTGTVDLYAELSNAGAPILAYYTSGSQLPQTSSGQPGSGILGLWTDNVGTLIFPTLSNPNDVTNLYRIVVTNGNGGTSYNGSITFTYVT